MPERGKAIEDFTDAVHRFPGIYEHAWLRVFGAKLGLHKPTEADRPLVNDLLALMTKDSADFTNVFANLGTPLARDQFLDRDAFDAWEMRRQGRAAPDALELMACVNPKIIPRNHRVEEAIVAGSGGDMNPFHTLLAAVTRPYETTSETAQFARAPTVNERVTRTFCGT